jgi:hypothetical protein
LLIWVKKFGIQIDGDEEASVMASAPAKLSPIGPDAMINSNQASFASVLSQTRGGKE